MDFSEIRGGRRSGFISVEDGVLLCGDAGGGRTCVAPSRDGTNREEDGAETCRDGVPEVIANAHRECGDDKACRTADSPLAQVHRFIIPLGVSFTGQTQSRNSLRNLKVVNTMPTAIMTT